MRKISPRLIYFFGALGGLLFGYDTGVISGAIGADVKIMDRFFRHRKVPLPRKIFKTQISAYNGVISGCFCRWNRAQPCR
ncbi:putative metabolite transport protein CsbC [Weissella cibaria]|uniref:CsbC_5 protein n=1 Tax=Weissella cibaria TaxID=137591 RepID=A0A0D1JL52_9LACO|nr:putative metabolite transport protein CsbC [Weissella cibaria]